MLHQQEVWRQLRQWSVIPEQTNAGELLKGLRLESHLAVPCEALQEMLCGLPERSRQLSEVREPQGFSG